MSEALFSINLKGELMSATFYRIDNELLERNLLDEELVKEILQRAKDSDKIDWSFTHKDVRVDILNKNSWKVEFFASRDEPNNSWEKSHIKKNSKKLLFN